jgi:hypothetical protein
MEVLIAVTLLGLLSAGMLTAMRVGFSTLGKTDAKLMENRRVAGAQRLLEQQLEGFIPVASLCKVNPDGPSPSADYRYAFFQGEPQAMRFVSAFSLQQGWRGPAQILEIGVIPGEEARGVRLIVNEIPYTRSLADLACIGQAPIPETNMTVPVFRPIEAGPRSFVLADKLEFCRFLYQEAEPGPPPQKYVWRNRKVLPRWPEAVRIEMAPLAVDYSRLQPISVTFPVRARRSMEVQYVDRH